MNKAIDRLRNMDYDRSGNPVSAGESRTQSCRSHGVEDTLCNIFSKRGRIRTAPMMGDTIEADY